MQTTSSIRPPLWIEHRLVTDRHRAIARPRPTRASIASITRVKISGSTIVRPYVLPVLGTTVTDDVIFAHNPRPVICVAKKYAWSVNQHGAAWIWYRDEAYLNWRAMGQHRIESKCDIYEYNWLVDKGALARVCTCLYIYSVFRSEE